MFKLYNTLSRKKETFRPIKEKKVGLYTCGPTVYWFAHIGNLRTYIFEDVLKRAFEYEGYKVKHVMNITDVGHLTSDADEGEDKMEIGAKREKKTARQIADYYTEAFKKDIKDLNIKEPDIWTKATDYIKEQIDLIKKLEKKGFTYQLEDGIYFDTSKIKDYGALAGKREKIKPGARVKMIEGKKSPTDFALWKFSPKDKQRQMEWDSPWGVGFPGWHTECVVMSIKHLGIPFDIHTGGIDHISIHHPNEIAQAKAAYNKKLANFWLHGEFLILKEGRMGKSKGNIITIPTLIEKGIDPLSYRYLCLTAHYRSKLTFSFRTLEAAENSLNNLREKLLELREKDNVKSKDTKTYKEKFEKYIKDDLDTPKALALMWDLIKDKNISNKDKYSLVLEFDKIFGLDLDKIKKLKISEEVKKLLKERKQAREKKDFKKSDKIRAKIKEKGYEVEDTKSGQKIKQIF